MNGFYKTNGKLRNVKLINGATQNMNTISQQKSESLSGTNNLMYLATNDV